MMSLIYYDRFEVPDNIVKQKPYIKKKSIITNE